MYQFSYLYGVLPFAIIWLAFFFLRKDLRSAMIPMSLLFGIGGATSQLVYAVDWWRPDNLTHTYVGFEDYFFGFFFGGVVGVCYEVFLNKRLGDRELPKPVISFRYLGGILCFIFFGLFLITDIHSYYLNLFAFLIPTILLFAQRPDLIKTGIVGALFGIPIVFLFMGVPELITPGWVRATWQVENLSGKFVWMSPREDFIWFIQAGGFIAPLYKFWKNKVEY